MILEGTASCQSEILLSKKVVSNKEVLQFVGKSSWDYVIIALVPNCAADIDRKLVPVKPGDVLLILCAFVLLAGLLA